MVGGERQPQPTRGADPHHLKKIQYANDWDTLRTVTILSSHPSVVSLRGGGVATLPPKGLGVIRLAVAPAPSGSALDAYLYVRDESGAVEETLLLRLTWT